MFGFSFEHMIVLGVVLLIFGPKRLPELGKAIGSTIREFKKGINHTTDDSHDRIASAKEDRSPASPSSKV